jgi:hypothetical protein
MMTLSARRPLPESALAALRPARSTLRDIAAAEARQRLLTLRHRNGKVVPFRRPKPLRRTMKALGLLLAVAAALVLILAA